jgi:hypothetical protein
MCFLLKTNANSSLSLIDKIVESHINSNLEIELNDIVPQNDAYIYHEPDTEFGPKLEDTTIIIFKNPIICKSNFDTLKKIPNAFLSNVHMENMTGIIEGLDNASTAPRTDPSGNIIIDNGDFLECSVADIDGNDISTYDVAINQQIPQKYITQFTTAAYFISTFLIIAISYFLTPAIYSLILKLFAQKNVNIDIRTLFKNIFITEWTIGSLIFWPAFILFFIGIGYLTNSKKTDDTAGYGYIGIAVNMLMFLIINIVILSFKKAVEPTFTGLKYTDAGAINDFNFYEAFNDSDVKKIMEDNFIIKAPYRIISSIFGILYILGKDPLF